MYERASISRDENGRREGRTTNYVKRLQSEGGVNDVDGGKLCVQLCIITIGVPGSPSDLNTGNGTEGAMVCTSLGSLFPVFKSEGEPGTCLVH